MSKMIQLRHVPDDLHRKLKARAASEGMTLSDFLIREAKRVADQPSMEEMLQRLSSRAPSRPRTSPARVLREERDRR